MRENVGMTPGEPGEKRRKKWLRGSSRTERREGEPSLLAGVEVRPEDVEHHPIISIAAWTFRIATVVLLLLAVYQVVDWLRDPPPGNTGMSVLIADTVRLVVWAFLLFGATDLAGLMVKNHYELRATRILVARQTYLMRQMGVAEGTLPADDARDAAGRMLEERVDPPVEDDRTS